MIVSDQQREENYQEYVQLLKDPEYIDVTFDTLSGGVSAVHRNHRFDKQMGPGGVKRGRYEQKVIESFRSEGHSIILLNESAEVGKKQYDGLLDGVPCEIKTVEHMGRWTIRTKIGNAIRQGASSIVLYFPNADMFSQLRVQNGWLDYLNYTNTTGFTIDIKVLCIVDDRIYTIEKPSW